MMNTRTARMLALQRLGEPAHLSTPSPRLPPEKRLRNGEACSKTWSTRSITIRLKIVYTRAEKNFIISASPGS